MHRRQFTAAVLVGSVAGCAGLSGDDTEGRLDLTVQNGGDEPVTARVNVVNEEGETFEDESDRIDGGVARSFDVTVGTGGRHEVTVTGDDWRGSLAWNVDTCAVYSGTVRVTSGSVEVAGECIDAP